MYRERRRACPACGTAMDEVPLSVDASDVQVDRCPDCGGLFLEFFDGEPSAISRRVERSSQPGPATQPEGPYRCSDCDTTMVPRAYLGQGPSIPRCESCLAVFLTPELREEMARLELPPEPAKEEPGWLRRLLGFLDRG